MSDVLEKAGIELFEDFNVDNLLDWKPDRVVVGNAVSRGNQQVEYLLKNRVFSFCSLPELIGQDLIEIDHLWWLLVLMVKRQQLRFQHLLWNKLGCLQVF